jgi:hypothetical protein
MNERSGIAPWWNVKSVRTKKELLTVVGDPDSTLKRTYPDVTDRQVPR